MRLLKALKEKKMPLSKECYRPKGKFLFFLLEHVRKKEENVPFPGDRELEFAEDTFTIHSQPGVSRLARMINNNHIFQGITPKYEQV